MFCSNVLDFVLNLHRPIENIKTDLRIRKELKESVEILLAS